MIFIVDFGNKADKLRLYNVMKDLKPVPYEVEIKIDRNKRSSNQNRYYFGVVIAILSEFTGFEPDEMHEYLRARFLKYIKVLPANNEEVELVKSTRNLDTKEFEDYMDKIRMFAVQELDVTIPLPNEVLEI